MTPPNPHRVSVAFPLFWVVLLLIMLLELPMNGCVTDRRNIDAVIERDLAAVRAQSAVHELHETETRAKIADVELAVARAHAEIAEAELAEARARAEIGEVCGAEVAP